MGGMAVVNVSIVIPTIHADDVMLHACIEAIVATAPDAELIVCDEGTFAENCNRGAELATGDVLIFLNDDTIPLEGWLDAMVDATEHAPIVGARLLYGDGRVQHTGVFFTTDPGGLVAYNRTWEEPSGEVPAVTGAAMLVRRPVWDMLEGFDTDFRNGYEDVDFCLRARQQGHHIWYTADATIFHHESQSGPARWAHVQDNVRLLQERWIVRDDPPAA
jgi:GT2 family glycosyltransferase